MKQEPPNNERNVLTWVREEDGAEYWGIDSYCTPQKYWREAKSWDQEVLYWEELPPSRLGLYEKD